MKYNSSPNDCFLLIAHYHVAAQGLGMGPDLLPDLHPPGLPGVTVFSVIKLFKQLCQYWSERNHCIFIPATLTDLELTIPPRCTRKPGGSLVIVRKGNSGISLSRALTCLAACLSELELPALAPAHTAILGVACL